MAREDSWILSRIHDKGGRLIGSVLLDSSARVDAAMNDLAYVSFQYKGKPLPTQAEFDRFERIDDAIQDLCTSHRCRCVAVWTAKGVRDWIVYCPDGKTFLIAVRASFSDYKPKVKVQSDRTWRQYFDLRSMVLDNSG